MTAEERRAHCRRIAASGGKRTAEKYGNEWMSAIGKRGFRAALESIGGIELYKILGKSYEQKFGRTLDVTQCRNREAAAQRAACRQQHPHMGGCEWIECDAAGEIVGTCGKPAAHRHHVERLRGGNGRENLRFYCADHHKAIHRIERARQRTR